MESHPAEGEITEPHSARRADPPIAVAAIEPRIFGVVPPALALVLGAAGIVAGIPTLASGGIAAGAVLLIGGLILFALAIDSARRWPASALPRISVRMVDGASSRLGLARASTAAWGRAARERIGLRREVRALRGEREAKQAELGAAAYREDDEEMEALRNRLAELDEEIDDTERAITRAVEQARTRVRRQRSSAVPTRPFAVAEEPPEDAPPRTEPTVRRSA